MVLYPQIHLSDPLNGYNETSFVPEPYSPSKETDVLHRFTRFGHTNNFEALITGIFSESGSAENYIVGCCAAAILIFAIALVWFMIVIGFKVAGPKRVGFLAGKLHHPECDLASSSPRDVGKLTVIEEEPSSFSSDAETESLIASDLSSPFLGSTVIRRNQKYARKVTAIRGIFFFSGLCVIVCGALFYAKGMVSFRKSLDETSYGLQLIQSTAYRATNISNTVLHDKNALVNSFNNTKNNVGGQLCNGEGFVPNLIRKSVGDFEEHLQAVNKMVDDNVASINDGAEELVSATNHVNDKLTEVRWSLLVSIIWSCSFPPTTCKK